ncbi:hypothetical protein ACVIQY_002552 [Bradyrhizobium sp. USDA 3051]
MHCYGIPIASWSFLRKRVWDVQPCSSKVSSEMTAQHWLDAVGGGWRSRPKAAACNSRAWIGTPMRDIVRDYVEHLADDDAVLVIDRTAFPKQGKASCSVTRRIHWFGRQDLRNATSESSLPKFRVMVIRSWTASRKDRRCGLAWYGALRASSLLNQRNGSPRLPQAAEAISEPRREAIRGSTR